MHALMSEHGVESASMASWPAVTETACNKYTSAGVLVLPTAGWSDVAGWSFSLQQLTCDTRACSRWSEFVAPETPFFRHVRFLVVCARTFAPCVQACRPRSVLHPLSGAELLVPSVLLQSCRRKPQLPAACFTSASMPFWIWACRRCLCTLDVWLRRPWLPRVHCCIRLTLLGLTPSDASQTAVARSSSNTDSLSSFSPIGGSVCKIT